MRLLVVEDEKNMNNLLVKKLQEENYNVDTCFDGETAVDYLMMTDYDGAIIDVMLPKLNGFEVLKKIRKEQVETPVLFLTALGETDDIITGLNLGANDYITKPFVFAEFLARVRVLVRHKSPTAGNIYSCGDLTLNVNTHSVTRQGNTISLSPREFSILLFLIRNKNQIVTRAQIEENIWSLDYDGYSNVIDVYIRYLRRKIDDDYDYKMIQTIRGVGYLLKCENENP